MNAPRIERVRTDAGWHGRILAGNGEPVWTTEVLEAPESVEIPCQVLVDLIRHIEQHPEIRHLEDVDERADAH